MSSRPRLSRVAFTIVFTAASSVTSAMPTSALPPAASISVTTARASSAEDFAFTTTAAPASASASAMARPMLRLAPVTSATRPSSSLACVMSSPPEWREVEPAGIEGAVRECEPCVGARAVPAAVGAVGAELLDDFRARERLVAAAAEMRLALLDDAPVGERHLHVAGELVGVGILRIDHIAHLGGERRDLRVARVLLGEGLQAHGAVQDGVGHAIGHAEFRGVGEIGRASCRERV